VDLLKQPEAKDGLVLIYGGSLHNDLHPNEGVKQWSYAVRIDELAQHRYIEVDLFVPELIGEDEVLSAEPWYGHRDSLASTEEVVVIERAPRSFVILLRKGRRGGPPLTESPGPARKR
jgi:hypothetical protein